MNGIIPSHNNTTATAFIVLGSRNSKNPEHVATVQVRKEHLNAYIGWDLKDVIGVGLPQDLRFKVLKDYEKRENEKGIYYLLYCSNY